MAGKINDDVLLGIPLEEIGMEFVEMKGCLAARILRRGWDLSPGGWADRQYGGGWTDRQLGEGWPARHGLWNGALKWWVARLRRTSSFD